MLSWRKTGKQLKKNKKNNAVRLNFFDTENYESMISEIEIFKEKIDELDFEKLKVDKIKSLKDYFRLEKHFLVLKQYKEAYFPYIQMETNYYPQNELIEIINKYNMLSSSKSTIDLYAEPEFWGYNIEQLVADYNEKGRIHRKAVDTLIHFEKNPDRKNINFFVRLINICLLYTSDAADE